MIITRDTDVIFQLGPVMAVFESDYKDTGMPGLVITAESEEGQQTISAPLAVEHIIQLQAYSLTAIVKKVDLLIAENEKLKAQLPKDEKSEAKIYKFPKSED